jgi:hypothetical protein
MRSNLLRCSMLLLLVLAGCSPDRHVADSSQHNPGLGSIIVFELDPDGTQLHVLEYPLTIRE